MGRINPELVSCWTWGEGGLFSLGVPIVTPSHRAQEPLKSGLACWVLTAGMTTQGASSGQSQAGIILVCHCFALFNLRENIPPDPVMTQTQEGDHLTLWWDVWISQRTVQSPSVLHRPMYGKWPCHSQAKPGWHLPGTEIGLFLVWGACVCS